MSSILRRIVTLTIVAIAVAAAVAAIALQPSRERAYAIGPSSPPAVEATAASRPVHPCSIATIVGDWAARQQNGKTADGQDLAAVGTFHLNRDGTSTTHGWYNVGGVFFGEFSRVGTTTVNADCTGTQTWNDGGPTAKTVVLRGGREIWAIYDQPGSGVVILKRINGPL